MVFCSVHCTVTSGATVKSTMPAEHKISCTICIFPGIHASTCHRRVGIQIHNSLQQFTAHHQCIGARPTTACPTWQGRSCFIIPIMVKCTILTSSASSKCFLDPVCPTRRARPLQAGLITYTTHGSTHLRTAAHTVPATPVTPSRCGTTPATSVHHKSKKDRHTTAAPAVGCRWDSLPSSQPHCGTTDNSLRRDYLYSKQKPKGGVAAEHTDSSPSHAPSCQLWR